MQALLKHLPPPALSRLQQWQQSVTRRWQRLNRQQKIYLATLLCLPFSTGLTVLLALTGLILDFWPRFVACWESLAGKAMLLLFYAGIANIALGLSGGLVNEVTGVAASFTPYTHNAAILFTVPAWLFGVSLVGLVLMQIIFPVYLVALVALRALGIRHSAVFASQHYPISTLLVRLGLSMFLLAQGVALLDEDAEAAKAGDQKVALPAQEVLPADVDEDLVVTLHKGGYGANVRQLAAYFVYFIEADGQSRCALADGAKAIDMNAFQYLQITRDPSQPYGFGFAVKSCQTPGVSHP